jgi:hypothetical protein
MLWGSRALGDKGERDGVLWEDGAASAMTDGDPMRCWTAWSETMQRARGRGMRAPDPSLILPGAQISKSECVEECRRQGIAASGAARGLRTRIEAMR